MVGSKGSANTGSYEWISGQLYCDGDGKMYTYNRFSRKRHYLTNAQMWDRHDMARRWGGKLRVRVRAGRQAW